jgi:hypothetical protein
MSKLIFDRNKSGSLIVSIMIFVLHLSILVGINPMETNDALGFVGFHQIQSGRNIRYIMKFMIEIRIHSGSRINLLEVLTRDFHIS